MFAQNVNIKTIKKMRNKIITEEGKKFLMVQCNQDIDYAFVSKSGKSWVYRINGMYLLYNGEIKGEEGKISGYMSKRLHQQVTPKSKHHHFHKGDLVQYDFGDGMVVHAVKVPIL